MGEFYRVWFDLEPDDCTETFPWNYVKWLKGDKAFENQAEPTNRWLVTSGGSQMKIKVYVHTYICYTMAFPPSDCNRVWRVNTFQKYYVRHQTNMYRTRGFKHYALIWLTTGDYDAVANKVWHVWRWHKLNSCLPWMNTCITLLDKAWVSCERMKNLCLAFRRCHAGCGRKVFGLTSLKFGHTIR